MMMEDVGGNDEKKTRAGQSNATNIDRPTGKGVLEQLLIPYLFTRIEVEAFAGVL